MSLLTRNFDKVIGQQKWEITSTLVTNHLIEVIRYDSSYMLKKISGNDIDVHLVF